MANCGRVSSTKIIGNFVKRQFGNMTSQPNRHMPRPDHPRLATWARQIAHFQLVSFRNQLRDLANGWLLNSPTIHFLKLFKCIQNFGRDWLSMHLRMKPDRFKTALETTKVQWLTCDLINHRWRYCDRIGGAPLQYKSPPRGFVRHPQPHHQTATQKPQKSRRPLALRARPRHRLYSHHYG